MEERQNGAGGSQEKEKQEKKFVEAGFGRDGKPSPEALKGWLSRAGIAFGLCAALACAMAVVSSVEDRKAVAVLEVEADRKVELILNRKGKVLKSEPEGVSDKELANGLSWAFGQAGDELLKREAPGALMTLRPEENGKNVKLGQLANQAGSAAGEVLRQNQSRVTVYLGIVPLTEASEVSKTSAELGISSGKAAFLIDLMDQNIRVQRADVARMASLNMDGLRAEIEVQKYSTSYEIVTAKAVYQRRDDWIFETEESLAVTQESESGTAAQDEKTKENGQGGTGNPTVTTKETGSREAQDSGRESGTTNPLNLQDLEETADVPEAERTGQEPSEATDGLRETIAGEPTSTPTTAALPETTAAATTAPPQTTAAPTTAAPTTAAPTTAPPQTTAAPTTAAPPQTTAAPTTAAPTTAPPQTTAAPTETSASGMVEPESTAYHPAGPGYEPEPEEELLTQVIPAFRNENAEPGA